MNRFLLIISLFFISLTINAQDNWEFSNTTPKSLVKSHFYFLEKGHTNINLATYTMESNNLSNKQKQNRIKKLKKVMIALNIDIDEISDRRKGIAKKDIYHLFPNEKKYI